MVNDASVAVVGKVAVDGAVDMSATSVIDLDGYNHRHATWTSDRLSPRLRPTRVEEVDKGGAHLHGAVDDQVNVNDCVKDR